MSLISIIVIIKIVSMCNCSYELAKRENKTSWQLSESPFEGSTYRVATPRWRIEKALRAPPVDVLRNTRLNSEMAISAFPTTISRENWRESPATSCAIKQCKTLQIKYLHVHLRVAPLTLCSNCNRRVQPPTVARTRELSSVIFVKRFTTNSRRVYNTWTHACVHFHGRLRNAVRRHASKTIAIVLLVVGAEMRDRANEPVNRREQPHGMATADATQRVRRFKRYVTVSVRPLIGRRGDRRPIGRVLTESRGKAKCSVTVARRNSTANSRTQFFNRSFVSLAPILEQKRVPTTMISVRSVTPKNLVPLIFNIVFN